MLTTLARGLEVLTMIGANDGPMEAKEIHRRLNISVSSCYNLLQTLESKGWVRHEGAAYALGPSLTDLASGVDRSVDPHHPELLEILHRLQEVVHETAYVVTVQGDEIVLLDSIESAHSLRVGGLMRGFRGMDHARASSKAVIAYWSEDRIRAHFNLRGLPSLTANTSTDIEVLLRKLEEVRRKGFSIDNQEFSEGIVCIGAPILGDDDSPVGAYAVSAPVRRACDRVQSLVDHVVHAGQLASQLFTRTTPGNKRNARIAS